MIAPWYAIVYNQLERIAWRYGYCLALHGSMARDLDLICVPWTDDASEPKKLLNAFCKFVTTKTQVKVHVSGPTSKPHGRQAYVIPLGHEGHYLDISILPLRNPS